MYLIPAPFWSMQASSEYQSGRVEEAEEKARKAKIFSIIGIVAGTILNVVVVVIVIAYVAAVNVAASSSWEVIATVHIMNMWLPIS